MDDPSTRTPRLQPLVISAPFGNYVDLDHATKTLGTFTARRRGGVFARAFRALGTLRYYPRLRAWVNRMGLRNPGIDWLAKRVFRGASVVSDKIVSIHGFDADEWYYLIDRIDEIEPLAVELNMSCPNVETGPRWPDDLFERALATKSLVIVKLPPVGYQDLVESAQRAGVTYLHCCNTLPVPGGGMSGKPLMPIALRCIQDIRGRSWGADMTIIGGGGVYEPDDVDAYVDAGANHVALGSKLLNPKYLITFDDLQPIIDRACSLLPVPEPRADPLDAAAPEYAPGDDAHT